MLLLCNSSSDHSFLLGEAGLLEEENDWKLSDKCRELADELAVIVLGDPGKAGDGLGASNESRLLSVSRLLRL